MRHSSWFVTAVGLSGLAGIVLGIGGTDYEHAEARPPAPVTVAKAPPPEPPVLATSTTTAAVRVEARQNGAERKPPGPVAVIRTTTTVPEDARCPQWWSTFAIAFPADELRNADRVAWEESRCQPDAHRTVSGRVGSGDHGLFQINMVHLPMLAEYGISAQELFTPAVNVVAAWIIYEQAQDWYGCGWQPWYMSIDPDRLCN